MMFCFVEPNVRVQKPIGHCVDYPGRDPFAKRRVNEDPAAAFLYRDHEHFQIFAKGLSLLIEGAEVVVTGALEADNPATPI